ncbi:MAG: hypothetical protein SO170_10770 [Butyribacter sp.]|nr:hypothetical protein [bacterium]MDY3855417.1 hypothetical protein [Butyribacter sp.]
MKQHLSKQWIQSFFIMLIAVLLMGFSLSLLVLTHFGTDPCSAMNYGISKLIGISFGNYQVIFNLVLLIAVILFHRSSIGFGTLGNMFLVGYTADFFAYIWHNVCQIPQELPFGVRVGILIPALLLFVFAAACYMQSGQGMAPYDAIPFIIDEKIMEKTKGSSHFKPIRLSIDLLASLVGFFTGGEFGAITVLMVLTLAPTVQFVGTIFQKRNAKAA